MSHRVFHVESGETAYRVGIPGSQQTVCVWMNRMPK